MSSAFPRTIVGGVSVPRLICGTNWLLGYSHTSRAKDRLITELFDTPKKVADVIEVFARAGCNAVMSSPAEFIATAIREAEQRTGERYRLDRNAGDCFTRWRSQRMGGGG